MNEFIFKNGCIVKLSEDKKTLRLYRGVDSPAIASMPYTGGSLEKLGHAMIFGYFAGWTGCYDKIKEKAVKMLNESRL